MARLSHLSQFGLFLFTVGALYFTVLPLYQKALLDEAIARKEVDLKQANEALEKSYSELKASVVREYVFYSGAKCSGLWGPDDTESKSGKPQLTVAEETFGIDVRSCLKEMLSIRKIARDLRPGDYEFLVDRIDEASDRLSLKRQIAMAEYENISERARVDPMSIPPITGDAAQMIGVFEQYEDINSDTNQSDKLKRKVRRDKERFKLAIRIEKGRMASAYGKDIRNEVAALNLLKWP